jgi:glycerophosphoryl diester phosphodiesterase
MDRRPLVLGHRGASAAAPENTRAAFARARAMGADGVELDVHRTADAVLVVHHDPHLESGALILDQDFTRLRSAYPDLLTLAEALDWCSGMIVNVEIKCCAWDPDPDTPEHHVVRAVVDAIRATDVEVIVSSFDIANIDACRAMAPELTTAWLAHDQELGTAAAHAAEHGHTWLNPDRKRALNAPAGEIRAVHEQGLSIAVWTVDAPDEITALAEAGVDALITNVPDVALEVLGRL